MPIFEHIELFLDSTYSSDDQKRFIFWSRCICNFVERAIAGVKFQSPYSRLNIHCTRNPQLKRIQPLKNEPFLEVCIPFDFEALDSIPQASLQKRFAQVIVSGLECARAVAIFPENACLKALNDFELGGYKNRWAHLDKSWSKWKCQCIIYAELTMTDFELEQIIYRSGGLIAARKIARTKPREGLFVDYLGDLSISADGIMTYRKRTKVLSAFNLHAGVFFDPKEPTCQPKRGAD